MKLLLLIFEGEKSGRKACAEFQGLNFVIFSET